MSHWFYNTSSGDLANEGGPLGTIVGLLNTNTPGLGWHELHIPGTATLAEAAAEARREFPHAAPPTGNAGQAVKQQVSSQTGLPLTGVAAIGDFFSRLGQANTWIRVGEVVAGLILLGIGLNAMFKGKPMQIVTKTAGVAGKAAML
jgi:hypothetical protein